MCDKIFLFTDGSVSPSTHIGYGTYLITRNLSGLKEGNYPKPKTRRFSPTSSTKLELETLIWALSELPQGDHKVTVYTDSQNTRKLLDRRKKLEQSGFKNKKGTPLKNANIYRTFFQQCDHLDLNIVKVDGHSPLDQKNEIDRLFSIVDRASRQALRENTNL